MDEHASIFYVKPAGYYVLCTDSELETLIAQRRRSFMKFLYKLYGPDLEPYRTVPAAGGHLGMRVIYNPEKTEQLRRPDGYVDRYIEVDKDWLQQRKLAFDLAYPAGLPLKLLERYKKPELDC